MDELLDIVFFVLSNLINLLHMSVIYSRKCKYRKFSITKSGSGNWVGEGQHFERNGPCLCQPMSG